MWEPRRLTTYWPPRSVTGITFYLYLVVPTPYVGVQLVSIYSNLVWIFGLFPRSEVKPSSVSKSISLVLFVSRAILARQTGDRWRQLWMFRPRLMFRESPSYVYYVYSRAALASQYLYIIRSGVFVNTLTRSSFLRLLLLYTDCNPPPSRLEIKERGYTKETGNRNATAISENCYQPEFNTCYWMEQRKCIAVS
jgi:hypothetical protein